MPDVAGATVRGWLGSLSDAEIVAKLADLDAGGGSAPDLSGYVETTRKVNGHPLSADVSVTGSDTLLVGYEIGTTALAPIAGTDTVNDAIAKLEKRIADLESAAS